MQAISVLIVILAPFAVTFVLLSKRDWQSLLNRGGVDE